MKKQILKSTHEVVLRIGNSEMDVAVLEGGTRIITQSAVFRASGRPPRGTTRLINVPTFMDARNLQPFINEYLNLVINKIEYNYYKLVLLLVELREVINHLRVVSVIHAYITLCNAYIRVSHEFRYKHNIFSV